MQIQLFNGTATKTLPAIIEGSRASVHWGVAGYYPIDLTRGVVQAPVLGLSGAHSVDLDTGRVLGTRYALSRRDVLRAGELEPGDEVLVVHDGDPDAQARGRVTRRTTTELRLTVNPLGHRPLARPHYDTAWRVEEESLQQLRRACRR